FVYMVAVSLSAYDQVVNVVLWPVGFNFDAYIAIFQMKSIWLGFLNSILYTFVGLFFSMTLSVLCAYPLSKKWLPGKKFITIFVLFTMYFGGGLIPCYLVATQILHLKNTIFAIVLPGALNTYFMILIRTYFTNIPSEIEEAARIDGANELQILTRIYLPLSKPILATISLYYIVISWNGWFSASIYLDNEAMYPLQLLLRNALATGNIWIGAQGTDVNYQSMNYALTMVVVLPMLILFPICQKYFVKGARVGSLKE
ncbi:MAG: carbohydrate ABC transporter permease, partial [Bacilli bacterium]|nr:carbohydrate ABC transporter permease [Bacilli bacterium]